MDAQLDDAFAYGFTVLEVAGLYLAQADADAGLCDLVAQRFEPVGGRLAAVVLPVARRSITGTDVAK